MSRIKVIAIVFLGIILAGIAGFGGSYLYNRYFFEPVSSNYQALTADSPDYNLRYADYNAAHNSRPLPVEKEDFISASEKSRRSVVFIKGIGEEQRTYSSPWDRFFEYFTEPTPSVSFGSGVIISNDGFIATNNHVIEDAKRIEVKVEGQIQSYKAELIGSDRSSDLALLKIKAENLPALKFANSDDLQIGEWVLAAGNPFNLTATVTAGIVSAKGRNINLLKNKFPIESFIQTDAAINPGNSGGALVNLKGELVGINTAILSKTGSYAGYGFAIPSNIVKKIIDDIREYGIVQRAFVEADVNDLTEENVERSSKAESGVVITRVIDNGAADKAGLKKGDIVTEINNYKIEDRADFDERIAYQRPGDVISIKYLRNADSRQTKLTLVNSNGQTEVVKYQSVKSKAVGAEFLNLSKIEKDELGIDYGVKVKPKPGGLISQMGIPENFIILSVNNQAVADAQKLVEALEQYRGRIIIKGVTEGGSLKAYGGYIR